MKLLRQCRQTPCQNQRGWLPPARSKLDGLPVRWGWDMRDGGREVPTRKTVKAFLTWELSFLHLFGCPGYVSEPSPNWRKSIHIWKNPAGQSGAPFDGFALFWGKFPAISAAFLMLHITLPRQKGSAVFRCCLKPGDMPSQPGAGRQMLTQWTWQGGLQPNMAGTSLSCAGLGWDILAWLGSLLQGRPLQGLPAR